MGIGGVGFRVCILATQVTDGREGDVDGDVDGDAVEAGNRDGDGGGV